MVDDLEETFGRELGGERRSDGCHTLGLEGFEDVNDLREGRMERVAQAKAGVFVCVGHVHAFAAVVLEADEVAFVGRGHALLEIGMVFVVLHQEFT